VQDTRERNLGASPNISAAQAVVLFLFHNRPSQVRYRLLPSPVHQVVAVHVAHVEHQLVEHLQLVAAAAAAAAVVKAR
jgi:hypothetical protein